MHSALSGSDRINVHAACSAAFAAVDAFVFLHAQAVKANLVEQAVNRAERADGFAEKTVDQHAGAERKHKHGEFDIEKRTDGLTQLLACAQQRDAAKERSGRTNPLAKGRFAHAHKVSDGNGQQQHQNQQHGVFPVACLMRQVKLRGFDGADEVLYKTKWAKESADKPSKQYAYRQQKAAT